MRKAKVFLINQQKKYCPENNTIKAAFLNYDKAVDFIEELEDDKGTDMWEYFIIEMELNTDA